MNVRTISGFNFVPFVFFVADSPNPKSFIYVTFLSSVVNSALPFDPPHSNRYISLTAILEQLSVTRIKSSPH